MTEFYTYEPSLDIGFADRQSIRLVLTVKTERKTNRGVKRYTAAWNCHIYNTIGNEHSVVCDDEIPQDVAHEMRRCVNNTLTLIRLGIVVVHIFMFNKLDRYDTYSFRGYLGV